MSKIKTSSQQELSFLNTSINLSGTLVNVCFENMKRIKSFYPIIDDLQLNQVKNSCTSAWCRLDELEIYFASATLQNVWVYMCVFSFIFASDFC
eukprot:TRINITY_DN13940_c0_g1_i1.p1 TRINITY_DN13940_c0_g1~~TRINITY_DN13940_c0_g1_i1.p1  ORF type:complete len:94 (+),score=18.47 TRINITY_DN13940_c0_g1_i1:361-642(+)